MPVTTYPAPHSAKPFTGSNPTPSAESLLKTSCPAEGEQFKNLLSSSFTGASPSYSIYPPSAKDAPPTPLYNSPNGFVHSVISAYNTHHHLRLRPEDIWFAILSQLSFYITANSEKLRKTFVAHKGKKELEITFVGAFDFGLLAFQMGKLMQDNVLDQDLHKWIMPDFSTTTKTDQVVASVLMMGALQNYFSYTLRRLRCGIPSVTLLGKKEDWEKLEARLEKLLGFGKETVKWHSLLKPILARFVKTFDEPESQETKDFWQKIAHRSGGGSGPTYLSGWIIAFCFWNEQGKRISDPMPDARAAAGPHRASAAPLEMDGIRYHQIDSGLIPPGFAGVPVRVIDEAFQPVRKYQTRMVAGSVAFEVSGQGNTRNTLQPTTGWWVYETLEEGEPKDEGEKEKVGETAAAQVVTGQETKKTMVERIAGLYGGMTSSAKQ